MKKKNLLKKQNLKTFLVLVGLVIIGFSLGANQAVVRNILTNPFAALSSPKGETISAKQLAAMLKKKDFILINVHTPYEGEIAGTDTFVPYDQIPANSASLPKDKQAPIILYCKTGRMSGEAIATLKKLGYTNVRHLAGGMDAWQKTGAALMDLSTLENEVVPQAGFELPIAWDDIGPRLIALGVIDVTKFKQAVKLTAEQEEILTKGSDKKIRIDAASSQFVVDMLWALGLAQKSAVYEDGPMGKEYKKDAGNFASTGGWTLARGDAMQYLNKFDIVKLSPEQQKLVGDIAQNVYRPCCGNSTWFPDCNHGMAALAAIALLVAAGVDEKDIYRHVLSLNSFWFADSYLYVATHFARQGIPWASVDAKAVLGKDYSSAQGAGDVSKKVGPLPYKPEQKGGGCGA